MGKVDNMQGQMGNVSREMESKEVNGNIRDQK